MQKTFLLLFFLINFCGNIFAQNPQFEQRRQQYIDSALANFNDNAITVQAYLGLPVDPTALNNALANSVSSSVSDFDIVKLVRVLCLSNGEYDSQIIPVLQQIPFWLTKDDHLRVYWSENHAIMWMSCHWLLYERYGFAIDQNLRNRLVHFLNLKVNYGFYEFFSTTYASYTLSGLLNLADFAADAEIKNLATKVAQKLLIEMLALTNDQGAIYTAAGRNYYSHYRNTYEKNFFRNIYMLTGLGPAPSSGSHSGGFLATSTIPLDTVINSWTPTLDKVFSIGHTLQEGFVINQGLASADRTLFQWSSGAYFHPLVAQESAQLLADSNLWGHGEFAPLASLQIIPIQNFPTVAENLNYMSYSSVICGQDVAVFRNGGVVLTSIQNFWKGKQGFQQFPCVATVGTTAVLAASGEVNPDWLNRNSDNANEHLPLVTQQSNVALLMYYPETKPSILGAQNRAVSLHWRTQEFDETTENNLWLLGRQNQNYIAVYRPCTDEINTLKACESPDRQTWAMIVGNENMYGSFENFSALIAQAQVTEEFYFDTLTQDTVYHASISFDTTTVENTWLRSGTEQVGISNPDQVKADSLLVYPNPSEGFFYLKGIEKPFTAAVFDALGRKILSSENIETIDISEQNSGIYLVKIQNDKQYLSFRVVKK